MTDAGPDAGTWAAGWYPDPFGRAPVRWWDGAAWSGYAGHAGSVGWDPAPVEEPVVREVGLPGLLTAAIGAAIGLALSFGVGAILDAADDPGGLAVELGLSSLALWIGLLGACVAVSVRRGTGSFVRDLGFRFRWIDLGLGLATALGARLVSGAMLAPIPFPMRDLRDLDRAALDERIHGAFGWTVLVLVTCVGAPLVEELFFRGLVQTRLVTRFGPGVGIVVASLIFGAAHLIAWQGPITLALGWSIAGGGLVFGLARHHSGRLGTSIAAHVYFNAQAMILLAFLG